ncbi:MAG: ATP-grasp domain-containing protein [Methylococcales bacterium]|jgi:biotin carboxylase|nr:ATP-grasp domain-containing protein [Methylococcales bacterium]MBT7445689.1 ATP-grasp domain-containing protein [Methylococcales bacterium]
MKNIPTFTICLTCVGGRLIYDIISALRDAEDFNVHLIGIDADESAQGQLLCDEFVTLPIAESYPDKWLEGIKSIHNRQPINGIIALSEGESRLVSEQTCLFEQLGIQLSTSSWDTVQTMTDKWLMLSKLKDHNIDCGEFLLLTDTQDFRSIAKELGYPKKKVVFKPRQGRGSRGVIIADAQISQYTQLLPNRFCGTGKLDDIETIMTENDCSMDDYIAMPHYSGDTSDVDCIAIKGKTINIAARVRQLKNPLSPTSTGHKVCMNPKVIRYAEILCEVFNVDGAGDFDIVIDDAGEAKVLDAAARFSGSVGVSSIAGMNMMAQLIRVMMSLPTVEYSIQDNLIIRPYITMAPIPEHNEAIRL